LLAASEVDVIKFLQRMENAQRSRLLQGNASLNRGSDSIARSHQVAAETDHVADEIVSELGVQRESLLRTQDRVIFMMVIIRFLFMAALRSRCGHYMFALWFLIISSIFLSFLA